MEFKPIWISSVDHFNKLTDANNNTNFFMKALGYYNIPKDFPYLWVSQLGMPTTISSRIPAVFFGSSAMKIEGERILFSSLAPTPVGSFFARYNYKNIQQIELQIDKVDIISIERFEPKPMLKPFTYFNINWIRVKTNKDALNGDFLLCVGGDGFNMEGIHKSTNSLYEALLKFIK